MVFTENEVTAEATGRIRGTTLGKNQADFIQTAAQVESQLTQKMDCIQNAETIVVTCKVIVP